MEERKDLVKILSYILADTYMLANMTQGFHWNVTGPGFFQLHQAFGDQYEALNASVDLLAERIRALGAKAPVGLAAIVELADLETKAPEDSPGMVTYLIKAHTKCATFCQEVASTIEDEGTKNMLADLVLFHEKTVWMLRSEAGG